jgi:hypothetical protein
MIEWTEGTAAFDDNTINGEAVSQTLLGTYEYLLHIQLPNSFSLVPRLFI